jgi:hypothetical protein
MGETLLTITILTLVILAIHRARPVVLENPVVIHRPGHYHIILAPQLNRAQTFIEQIAKPYILMHPPLEDIPTQYYEIRDPIVFAKGESVYLLAVTLRHGMLFFQAANPEPMQHDADSHIKTLREVSESALIQYPFIKPADEQWAKKLRDTVEKIAGQMQISVKELQMAD